MSNPASALAPAIAAYIAAANARDTSRIGSFFAEDANVFDEGQHRIGKVLVNGLISGTFPGSPLELRYMFRLNDQGKIARLDISL
ncbi:hypothetical protein D3C73_386350 [compost metagenome]